MSTPTRREIWEALRNGPQRLPQIVAKTGIRYTSCARILSEMRADGFVRMPAKRLYERVS